MSKITAFPLFAAILLLLSSCLPLPQTSNDSNNAAIIKTAVAGTLAVERAREAGAELLATNSPEGTAEESNTPEAEDGQPTASPETEGEDQAPQPTPDNPWMLQSWCADHQEGCIYYGLNNRTDSWLQVELKETETGVTGFFTVRSKTYAQINLIPGQYQVKYTWWCDNQTSSLSEVKSLGSWIDDFKCPQGYYQRREK